VEEDSSDQITDSRKQLGGAGLGAPLFVFGKRERGNLTQRKRAEKRKRNPRAQPGMAVPQRGRMELNEGQMRVVERLFGAGFRPIAIPPYESALIMRKGECVALLGPVENGGLKLLAPETFLVDGNLSVRLKKSSGDVFVWKKREVAATEEKLKELEEFRAELVGILESYSL
jgi:hypothetical protein